MRAALLCPGQGRQDRQILAALAMEPAAWTIFAAASGLLGRDVLSFIAEATDEALHANRTGQIYASPTRLPPPPRCSRMGCRRISSGRYRLAASAAKLASTDRTQRTTRPRIGDGTS